MVIFVNIFLSCDAGLETESNCSKAIRDEEVPITHSYQLNLFSSELLTKL